MPCELCDDSEGVCVFPYYGVAPHVHDVTGRESHADPMAIMGSTRVLPKSEWPSNFQEDPECPGLGTYTHCPRCGDGARPALSGGKE
jgi:hypothetical protein